MQSAHHSFNATFDASREVQLEGVVGDARCRNAHVGFGLQVTSGWTTITDPSTLTEAVEIDKYDLYFPGVEVQSFECTP